MIDQIRDFLAAGPERRKAMESAINSGLHKYLGPTGIPQRIGAASEVFNPVVGIEQAGTASRQMMDPRLSLYDRIGAGGRMASEIAGVVAPAGAARLTGIGGDDAARALEEALTGFSARPGSVAAKDFAGDEAGAIKIIESPIDAYHGSPTLDDISQFSVNAPKRTDYGYLGSGMYVTPQEFIAREYAGRTGTVHKVPLPPGKYEDFIYDENYQKAVEDFARDLGVTAEPRTQAWADEFAKKMRQSGYVGARGVNVDGSGFSEAVIYPPAPLDGLPR